MANTKITGLTALTAPVGADLLVIVDDVAVTPVTKKIALSDILPDGGIAGQKLVKIDGTDYNTEWVSEALQAAMLGLSAATAVVANVAKVIPYAVKTNNITGLTVASGVLSLPVGTFLLNASYVGAYGLYNAAMALWNETTNALVEAGETYHVPSGSSGYYPIVSMHSKFLLVVGSAADYSIQIKGNVSSTQWSTTVFTGTANYGSLQIIKVQ